LYGSCMRGSLKHFVHGSLLASALGAHNISASVATPITQKLVRPSSSIKFGVDSPSPTLKMSGQLQTFTGTITLNGDGSAVSELTMTVQLDSAQLPPDQMLQGIFLHSVIARLRQNVATFRSSTIERSEVGEYRATGSYTWHNRSRPATLPFRIVQASPTHSELRILMRGALTDATTPKELSSAAPGASQSSGWARATLIFARPKVS
jgi:polyisoprenoid-binding protein YceI